MHLRGAVVLVGLATASTVVAQSTAQQSAKVDSIMATFVGAGAPGAAVMVIHDGQVVHKKGYGLANVDAKVPITTSTAFDLASVSKQFTAMAIMILAERGKLGLDDSLTTT
jgi:CubicO group peptidase (beta-lactamase class C family)